MWLYRYGVDENGRIDTKFMKPVIQCGIYENDQIHAEITQKAIIRTTSSIMQTILGLRISTSIKERE